MVFCGKPSKGCQTCRQRKIRCDQAPDGCSQCIKLDRKCPGYRDQLDLMFRNESTEVVRRAKAREAKIKPGSARSSAISSLVSSPADALVPNTENVLDIVRGKNSQSSTFQPPLFSIIPTIEERATGFFFTNFVIGVHGPTRGHLDRLETIYNSEDMDDNLLASMRSVGLAGYSHAAHAPELMKDARHEYMKALRLTNLALRSPKDVKKDSTLLAIMVLGIFETVTGCNQRSMKAWAEHINGAAALVKLRGVEQLRTPPGRRIFIQVTSNLLISCIQRRLAIPEHIIELRAEVAKYVDTTDPAWRIHDSLIAFANFRSQIRTGEISDLQAILSKALEIDGTLLEIFSNVPQVWTYETVFTAADPDIVFNGCYHIYFDFWIAQLWNAMRSIRIFVNEQIRDVLLKGFTMRPPLFVGPEYTAQFQISTDIIYELSNDVLASVPQHLGYVSNRHQQSQISKSATSANSNGTSSRCLWTGFENASSTFPWKACDVQPSTTIRASGGYFLLWPLYLVGNTDVTTEPVRQWVIKSLRSIGQTMGIQQAIVLATLMERQEGIKVWEEKQRSMSVTDLSVSAMDIAQDLDAD